MKKGDFPLTRAGISGIVGWGIFNYMFWTILGIITFLVFIAALAFVFVRDRRRERASVAETMSKGLWDEIADERELALTRAKKFKEELKKAGTVKS